MKFFTRRQWLTTVGTSTLVPYLYPRAAETKAMRGAFIILSTPYTSSNEVDYEDLANQVHFLGRCGVHGLVWPQNSSEQRFLSKEERLRGFDVLAKASMGAESALILNEEIHRRLKSVVDDGELAGLFSLHAFLWPESLQRRNLAALQVDVGLVTRIVMA